MSYAYVIVEQKEKPYRAYQHLRTGDLVASPVPGFDHLCLNGGEVSKEQYLPIYWLIGDRYRPAKIERVRRQRIIEKLLSKVAGRPIYLAKPMMETVDNPEYRHGYFCLPIVTVESISGKNVIRNIAELL